MRGGDCPRPECAGSGFAEWVHGLMGRPIAVIAEGLPDRPGLEERLHGASAAGAAQLFAGAHAARVRNTERECVGGGALI